MAGGKLVRRHLAQLRRNGLALFNGIGTARLKATTWLRVHDLRRFTSVDGDGVIERTTWIGNRGEKEFRVGMARIRQDLLGRTYLDDVAGVHDDDPVSNVASRGEIVRDVKNGDALAFS
jgi:hypothetical protein